MFVTFTSESKTINNEYHEFLKEHTDLSQISGSYLFHYDCLNAYNKLPGFKTIKIKVEGCRLKVRVLFSKNLP